MSRVRARKERPAITMSPSMPQAARAWAACWEG